MSEQNWKTISSGAPATTPDEIIEQMTKLIGAHKGLTAGRSDESVAEDNATQSLIGGALVNLARIADALEVMAKSSDQSVHELNGLFNILQARV